MKPAQGRAVELAEWMKENDRYRVSELARAVGMKPPSVSAILNGNRYVSMERVALLESAARELEPLAWRPMAGGSGASNGEGRRMASELARVLKRTGRYNVCELARRTGRPRRSVCRALNGGPVSVYLVEELALAAGVDLAFLY